MSQLAVSFFSPYFAFLNITLNLKCNFLALAFLKPYNTTTQEYTSNNSHHSFSNFASIHHGRRRSYNSWYAIHWLSSRRSHVHIEPRFVHESAVLKEVHICLSSFSIYFLNEKLWSFFKKKIRMLVSFKLKFSKLSVRDATIVKSSLKRIIIEV